MYLYILRYMFNVSCSTCLTCIMLNMLDANVVFSQLLSLLCLTCLTDYVIFLDSINSVTFFNSNHEILMKAFNKNCILLIYINSQCDFISFTEFIWVSLCLFLSSIFSVRIILIYLISNDSFSSLTLFEVFTLRIASVVKLFSLFQQIKIVEVYCCRMFLIL